MPTLPRMALNPDLSRRMLALRDTDIGFEPVTGFRPGRLPIDLEQPPPPPPPAPTSPPVTPPAGPAPGPFTEVPAPPAAPAVDPFAELPFPNAGDRIKAEDFRKLAQGLRLIADAYSLAGATFGVPFGVVRPVLRAQGYEVARVVSAGGNQLASADDPSLDDRKVVAVAPLVLGQARVGVIVTETPQATDRRMPNLLGLTYRQATARLQEQVGDVLAGGGPMTVPQLVGRTLSEAERGLRR